MKERPIFFNDAMVRAILGGRKTQTRRVLDPQPAGDIVETAFSGFFINGNGNVLECKHGHKGDRLWVRECWAPYPGPGKPDGAFLYRASNSCGPEFKWRPSIHMPRCASRITLEITGVRVERLQDVSSADCKAEGFECCVPCDEKTDAARDKTGIPQTWYRELWQSIYGAESWQSNPWVWVVEFRRLECQA